MASAKVQKSFVSVVFFFIKFFSFNLNKKKKNEIQRKIAEWKEI